MELTELRERVGKAAGPDTHIDTDIEWALSDWTNIGGGWREHKTTKQRERFDYTRSSPPVTASIDAALGLAERCLPGWARGLDVGPRTCLAFVDRSDHADRFLGARFVAERQTAPLAILAALLDALIASPPEQKEGSTIAEFVETAVDLAENYEPTGIIVPKERP